MRSPPWLVMCTASLLACSDPPGDGSATEGRGAIGGSSAAVSGTGTAAAGGLALSPFFGFTENGTSADNYPTNISYGMQRFWDSPPLQWPSIDTCPSFPDTPCNTTTHPPTYVWGSLDSALEQAFGNGATEAMYTLARTPTWASANPSDSTSCHDGGSGNGLGNGECYPPSDLSSDGQGTNAIWKDWVTKIARHANGRDDPNCPSGPTCYTKTHAHIRYWETWNEPDETCSAAGQCFFKGSLAQLARMTEDLRCILLGSQGGANVIHDHGDGTATPCTATPIDSTALIVMSAVHARSQFQIDYGQNELYCSNTSGLTGNRAYQLPCPNPKDATANAIDVINVHMKPGNEGTTSSHCGADGSTLCSVETGMQWYMTGIRNILQHAESLKPFWDGEASYCPQGFTDANCTSYANDDLSASFFPRFYLIDWSLGISGIAFYTSDDIESQTGTKGPIAMQQTINWLRGATLTTPCTVAGTVWRCGITRSGTAHLVIWDSSCTSSTCVTQTTMQPVAPTWGHYQDMTTASTPTPIPGTHMVPVGIKPIVLSP